MSRIAVVNAGASTLKLALFDVAGDRIETLDRLSREWRPESGSADVLVEALAALSGEPQAFGYRVVHGGTDLTAPTTVTEGVERALEALIPLAPLHNAAVLAAMRSIRSRYPHLPGVAVFDTAFHAGRPAASMGYALPDELVKAFRIRRYGFHGLAHASLVAALAAEEDSDAAGVSAVTLQLGAGCSACAVQAGRSVETSMGFTPLEGLVMATRSGSVDPAVVLTLLRAGYDADGIEAVLTRQSGLAALAGESDMRRILAAVRQGEERARLALEVFCRRIVLTVGAYLTLLEGNGAVVFGGGIGANSPEVRARVAAGLAAWNVALDDGRNRRNVPGRISAEGSRAVFALATDEETLIARTVGEHLRL